MNLAERIAQAVWEKLMEPARMTFQIHHDKCKVHPMTNCSVHRDILAAVTAAMEQEGK